MLKSFKMLKIGMCAGLIGISLFIKWSSTSRCKGATE